MIRRLWHRWRANVWRKREQAGQAEIDRWPPYTLEKYAGLQQRELAHAMVEYHERQCVTSQFTQPK